MCWVVAVGDPFHDGSGQSLVLGPIAERPQSSHAYQRLVTHEPIKDLIEESRVVAPDLQRQQQQRLWVLRPSARRRRSGEHSHLCPFLPCELEQRGGESCLSAGICIVDAEIGQHFG